MASKKKIFVMWSGGLDSTALIWNYLKRGHHVAAAYFAWLNNPPQIQCELRAIDRMLPFLEQHPFKFKGVIGSFKWNYGTDSSFRHPQCPLWITACATLNEYYDEMALGYVRDDGVVRSDLSDFQSLWKSLHLFSNRANKLTFPLWKKSKKELFRELPKELKDHVWSCSHPRDGKRHRPCGKCDACKVFARAKSEN